jgi:hypothetical protein
LHSVLFTARNNGRKEAKNVVLPPTPFLETSKYISE